MVSCRLICRAAQSSKVQWAEVLRHQLVAQVLVTGGAVILVIIDIRAGLPLLTNSTNPQSPAVKLQQNELKFAPIQTWGGFRSNGSGA